jgi:hypothetical protein
MVARQRDLKQAWKLEEYEYEYVQEGEDIELEKNRDSSHRLRVVRARPERVALVGDGE